MASSKLEIAFITVGSLRSPIEIAKLERWSSQIFKIRHNGHIPSVPDAQGSDWRYSDDELQEIIRTIPGSQLTVALVSGPLQSNYYARRLTENRLVLSSYEVAEILKSDDIPIENFILRAAYAHSIYFHVNASTVPPSGDHSLSHQEIRGCLFDLNANKADLVASCSKPMLCTFCKAKFQNTQTPAKFWSNIDHELSRVKKPFYFRISSWVKSHPILAILIGATFSVVLNVFSNWIYDLLKK